VRDASLVALPDPRLGERACAFVIAEGEVPTLADLREHLSRRGLADYKLPDRLEVLDTFPLTNIGKVDKGRLRDALLRRLAGPAVAVTE
jgi:non-ribosomal peptide synthetase component E (peptide arylation enzyme)